MKKNAIVKIKNKEETIKEKVEIESKNNKISYLENKKTKVLFDLEKEILMRENKEIYMELFFKEEKAIIYIKNLRKNIEIVLKTKKIDISNNKIVIQYEMEKNLYLYELEME